MLATDEKRLRWWGIDMHARRRRRVAVVATYFVLFVMMVTATSNRWPSHVYWTLMGMVVSTTGWVAISVFRKNGAVKSFEDPLRMRGSMAGKIFVNGLDEWARYRYGVASFEEASEAQQAELLKRYRVGTFVVPAKPKGEQWTGLDEREIGERDDASRWALQRLAGLLAFYAATLAVKPKPIAPLVVAGFLWSFSLLARTLPQARVLWTERDPRAGVGEMEMVEREA
jgi:hypothetical protein